MFQVKSTGPDGARGFVASTHLTQSGISILPFLFPLFEAVTLRRCFPSLIVRPGGWFNVALSIPKNALDYTLHAQDNVAVIGFHSQGSLAKNWINVVIPLFVTPSSSGGLSFF